LPSGASRDGSWPILDQAEKACQAQTPKLIPIYRQLRRIVFIRNDFSRRQCIKHFFFITDEEAKYAIVFVHSKSTNTLAFHRVRQRKKSFMKSVFSWWSPMAPVANKNIVSQQTSEMKIKILTVSVSISN
jgi:hypothetical protein